MAKVSIGRRVSLYRQYSRAVSGNRTALGQLNIRVDMVDRLYTVVNIPEELFEGVYDSRASDILRISQTYMAEYLRNTSRALNEMGLAELYRVYETKRVGKHSFLVVIGFALFDTAKVAVGAAVASAAVAAAALVSIALQLV